MSKGVSSGFIGTAQKEIRNKRISLQTLQISADEQEITGKNMVHSDEETVPSKNKQSKAVKKVIAAEKENATGVRRSKRKTAASGVLNYAESPEVLKSSKSSCKIITKSKKTTAKTKKGQSATVKKSETENDLNQTKLNFLSVQSVLNRSPDLCASANSEENILLPLTSEIIDDNGFEPSNTISGQSFVQSIAVLKSPGEKITTLTSDDKTSILTSVSPPLNYWTDLAEQRRMALEKVLHENELLHDQLTVLEAENSQLKQLVKEAEHLAKIVRDIVE